MPWIEYELGILPKKPRWLKKRRAKKREFVLKHKSLCKKAFNIGTSHSHYKSIHGLKLIELARKELKYKDSTYAGDIYFGLWRQFEELFLRK